MALCLPHDMSRFMSLSSQSVLFVDLCSPRAFILEDSIACEQTISIGRITSFRPTPTKRLVHGLKTQGRIKNK